MSFYYWGLPSDVILISLDDPMFITGVGYHANQHVTQVLVLCSPKNKPPPLFDLQVLVVFLLHL